MKVILLDKIARLGGVGTEVDVKAGYARNYLLPKKLAVIANEANRAKFEAERQVLEQQAHEKLTYALNLADSLTNHGVFEVGVEAGTEGRLFGAVTNRNLAEILEVYGYKVDKSQIRIAGGVIRELGEHSVLVHLHSEVNVEIKVSVYAA